MMDVDDGMYTLVEGDTPRSVASVVYGDGNQYIKLLKANEGKMWYVGDQVVIPNKKGKATLVKAGESVQAVLKRMFPNQFSHMYIQRFIAWNGGADLIEGQLVFCPDR